jgi:hypothetical protein
MGIVTNKNALISYDNNNHNTLPGVNGLQDRESCFVNFDEVRGGGKGFPEFDSLYDELDCMNGVLGTNSGSEGPPG